MTYLTLYSGQIAGRRLPYRRLGADPAQEVYTHAQAQMRQQSQDQLSAVMGNVMNKLQKEMKENLLRSTATQLGITAALYAIPVAGQALALASGIAMQIGGAEYQARAEAVIKEAVATLEEEQEESLAKISIWLNAAFEQEKDPAMALAVSGDPLQGLGLGFYKKVVKQVKRSFKDVSDFMQEQVYDPVTGRNALTEARKARDKMLREGRQKLVEHEQHAKQQIDSPAFRATLRTMIAQAIRQQLPPNLVGQGLNTPSQKLVAPAIAAGAVVLASLMGVR